MENVLPYLHTKQLLQNARRKPCAAFWRSCFVFNAARGFLKDLFQARRCVGVTGENISLQQKHEIRFLWGFPEDG